MIFGCSRLRNYRNSAEEIALVRKPLRMAAKDLCVEIHWIPLGTALYPMF